MSLPEPVPRHQNIAPEPVIVARICPAHVVPGVKSPCTVQFHGRVEAVDFKLCPCDGL